MKKAIAIFALVLAFLMLHGCTATATELPITVTKSPSEPLMTVVTTEPPVTEVAPEAADTDIISREEAISIALEHAGVTAEEVKGLECEYDIDDGVKEYEVAFHKGKYEYNYDIYAETGKIRFWEKDLED